MALLQHGALQPNNWRFVGDDAAIPAEEPVTVSLKRWQAENEQLGAGPYPLSEPESRAQVDFLLDHNNVFGAHTYHTFCG